MKNNFSRRDFLKLLATLPLSAIGHRLVPSALFNRTEKTQNVIIIVFDAFSAYHISLYGYQRETTPNISRLAERAVVYHNHYSGGNFTTPGTSSLLTGTLPWKHRAFSHYEDLDDRYISNNIFSVFHNYHRLAYTHNPWVTKILKQVEEHLDENPKRNSLYLKNDFIIPTLFENDEDIAFVSWLRTMRRRDNDYAYSLFMASLYERYDKQVEAKFERIKKQYPRGFPALSDGNYFLLETAIDWFDKKIRSLPQPFLSYLHLFPPHDPYNTHREFFGRFKDDGLAIESKPKDSLQYIIDEKSNDELKHRMKYDEFILYVDREFGRLFDYLNNSGLLDNTWLILTSDHGEMFERGVVGHTTPLLYEPIIRVPLMIFEPGRTERLDIHTPTSVVDVLPTLLHVTGQKPAAWNEGMVLPPYASVALGEDRSIYVLEARNNKKYAPLNIATTALIKGQYKLTYFFGYDELSGKERIELYDIKTDPEEMNNLYDVKKETAGEMLHDLRKKLEEVNKPYI